MFLFFKQKTAYEMRISDWSSDVCSSDLDHRLRQASQAQDRARKQLLQRHRFARVARCLVTEHGDLQIEPGAETVAVGGKHDHAEIGRASCRESVCQYV